MAGVSVRGTAYACVPFGTHHLHRKVRIMTRPLSKILILPLVLLSTACSGDDDRTVDMVGMSDTTMMGPGTTQDRAMTPQTMGSTIALQAVGGSGITGETTLTESGQRTQIMVRLMGSQPDATHQGHIHQGTCANLGSIVVPLDPINVDAQSMGTSTTTVDVPIHTVANGQHLIAYHVTGGSPGAPVACGEVPAHTM